MAGNLTNWARNVEFQAAGGLRTPASLDELCALVAEGGRVRALGAGHSFNRAADTTGTLVSLSRMPRLAEVDTGARTVRAGAGMTFAQLCAALRPYGLALPNLPSTPHFTLAGAYATGTHGSGDAHGTLATAVRAVELVTADGKVSTLSSAEDGGVGGDFDGDFGGDFGGAVTSLGALGIATAVTLDLCPAFEVEQHVYEGLPWGAFTEHIDALPATAYSVSAFTDWGGDSVRLWLKRRVGDPLPDLAWTGARPATRPHHPIDGMPTANATEQLGVAGPWDERLPHFRSGFLPSAGDELQSEYLVPRTDAAAAVQALRTLRPWLAPVLQVSEIRSVAADGQWLSPSHGRASVAFHFTWVADAAAVEPVLVRLEEALAPFDARPHWGKLSTTAPEALRRSYARWDDFAALLARCDPGGTFRNAPLDHYFPAAPASG
ncbi:FAD-binding protein [Streptomyces armeniacus]|uniref:FAD-binding protein n=1 Tax=Streptomyces armeniacus TaxID=83291 RepID=A0A345XYM2_9ACTN|nr:FAD-binding protein [Streptomyces armeniacus]AXK36738.1 FAD-binding protein [Streptomyces armeniacus]